MRWRVRTASLADVDRLALVGGATFLETFAGVLDGPAIVLHCMREHGPDAYRRHLAAGAKAWLAEVEPGGAPVGFSLLGAADLPGMSSDGSDVELKRIYALSRFHGGGLGGELMRCAVEEATRRNARRLLLGVYAGNTRALGFYAKHGFERVTERWFRVGDRDYEDAVLAKRLA